MVHAPSVLSSTPCPWSPRTRLRVAVLVLLSGSTSAFDEMTYCGDTTCGTALLQQGWTVYAEFGAASSSRFGGDTINSHSNLTNAGWTTNCNVFNNVNYFVTPALFQFYKSGSLAGYTQKVESTPAEYLIAFADYHTTSNSNSYCRMQFKQDTYPFPYLTNSWSTATKTDPSAFPGGMKVRARRGIHPRALTLGACADATHPPRRPLRRVPDTCW